jgi:gamma-D-glutamyl-L-lysine dipeptidyl-peptidase
VHVAHADSGAPAPAVATERPVLVRAAVAPLHAEPRASSEQVSQSVAGHLATILELREGWRRVRLADGYEGWMHQGYIEAGALTPDQASAWTSASRYSLGCTASDPKSGEARAFPLGARVAREMRIVAGEVLNAQELSRRFPRDGVEICASARKWFSGTSYQWGGITPWGADCSGMVQTVFGMHGVALPRDARQQAELGSALALDAAAWQPGDLLFFSERPDGRITHVAIVALARALVHVGIGRGGFAVENIDDAADPYTVGLMKRLRAARRLL